jgi:radical SAM superfamily enzyme YgiQ (UPF0313 family)
MSGVRVKNQQLLATGMTLPGFVERSKVIASLPSLSLLILAAYTPESWEVQYREMDEPRDGDLEQIAAEQYDLVAISFLTARALEAYGVSDRLRAAGVTTVLGGLHASALPFEAMPHADAVVQGEGEVVWAELLRDFEDGRLQPLYSSMDGIRRPHQLEASPVPRYGLLSVEKYNRITLQTTRGCPLHCTFCAASRTISSYKLKPIALVRRELEAILAIWPRAFIELADDNSFVSKAWARDLAMALAEYPIKWFTETDISVADDEELLESLARSHCAQVLIGLESAKAESLKSVDTRDWKYRQFELYQEKIRKIQSYGISVNGCFVLGFDADDIGVFERTKEFILTSELAEVQITILTPFPGTALYAELRQQGRLMKEQFWDQCTLFDVAYQPKGMSHDELEQGFRWLMQEIYAPEQTARRKERFRSCVRKTHQFENTKTLTAGTP